VGGCVGVMPADNDGHETDGDFAYRIEVRKWLAEIAPLHERFPGKTPPPNSVADYDRSHVEAIDAARRWQRLSPYDATQGFAHPLALRQERVVPADECAALVVF